MFARICASTSARRAAMGAGAAGIGSSGAGRLNAATRTSSRGTIVLSMVPRVAEQQKVGRGPTAVTMEVAAPGVWVMRGGFPHRTMNVYFIEEPGGGVTLFDAGIEAMSKHVVNVGRIMGGINRVVLGHAHSDHRGAAPAVGAPVWCHVDEAQYAEAENPQPYFDFSGLPTWTKAGPAKAMYPSLLKMWDGGPVRVDRTLSEGESVAGFEVVHL